MFTDKLFDNVLVIAPHSDDDVLGCGGTVRRVIEAGGKVTVLVATVGDVQFYHSKKTVLANTRVEEFHNALDVLGVQDGRVLYMNQEQRLHMMPIVDLISEFDKVIREVKPTAVFIPYPSFHQDHKTVFDAAFAALRPTPHTDHIRLVAMYEYPFIVWSTHDSSKNRFYIDITEQLDHKVRAMSQHKSQLRPSAELISLETIALWAARRGLEIGVKYAESFEMLRLRI